MDKSDLKTLLEKYWMGETTLQEESLLKDWFAGHPETDALESERILFNHFAQTGKIELSQDFEHNILKQITKDKQKPPARRHLWFNWKAAAVVSGIIVASAVLKNPFGPSTQMTDTYDNPQDAYEATKAILMAISSNMNKGKKYTQQLSKFSEAQQKVSGVDIKVAKDGS